MQKSQFRMGGPDFLSGTLHEASCIIRFRENDPVPAYMHKILYGPEHENSSNYLR